MAPPVEGVLTECLYDSLGVERTVDPDKLKIAYRKMAMKWHPDKIQQSGAGTSPDAYQKATERFQQISRAYEVLSDPVERTWYDSHRERILQRNIVKYLFLVLVDLFKRTGPLPHLLPKSQLQSGNPPSLRLHFIDGQFTVAPEVVEASLGPHMQNLPRPRGAEAAGLLMRELELHPPVEDLNRRMLVDRLGSAFLETKNEEEETVVDP